MTLLIRDNENIQKGEIIGFKKGEMVGFKKAKMEAYQKEVKMVLKMISKNYNDYEIQDLSDFSIEEIAKIREENSNK